jgi:hypothetical protein
MTGQGAAGQDVLIVAPGGAGAGAPDVSVIVPVPAGVSPSPWGGPGSLGTTLESLAAQSLPRARFEVVVVMDVAAQGVQDELARFCVARPDHRVRVARASHASDGAARDLGLRAARAGHSVFLEPGQVASPGLLEGLLRGAEPGVVTVAGRGELTPGRPDEQLLRGLESSGGKLVATRLARTLRYADQAGRGGEFLHWLALSEREGVTFRLADGDATIRAATPAQDPSEGAGFSAAVLESLELVKQLRERPVPAGPSRDLAEQMVTHQAETLRELLVRHPERHGDVVAHVRTLGVPDMPWSVVNHGRARHLALLFLFTPFLDTSALVAARRLRERGWVTDVVCQDLGSLRTRDEASTLVAAEVVDQARMLSREALAAVATWPSVVAYADQALVEVEALEAEKGAYTSVYSRAMSIESHFAAALLKLRSPEIHWVAEFSDPLLYNARGEERVGHLEDDRLTAELAAGLRRAGHAVPEGRRMFEWAEVICYALADEIIFTNQHQLDFMLGYCRDQAVAARAAAVSRACHHPVPTPDLYDTVRSGYALVPGKVHIGYFGNFYVNRGLSEITGALDRLTAAERDRIQLHVFTAHPEALALETLEHGLADVITVNPMIGFLKYLNLTTRFDVLLITDFTTLPHYDPNPFLPAKLADYLGSGSDIWAVCERGSVLSTFDVAYSSELGDVDSATRVLRQLAVPETARALA